jgi:hypothetical protein
VLSLEASFLKKTIIPKETMGLKVSKKFEDLRKVISSLLMQPKLSTTMKVKESEESIHNTYPHQKKGSKV